MRTILGISFTLLATIAGNAFAAKPGDNVSSSIILEGAHHSYAMSDRVTLDIIYRNDNPTERYIWKLLAVGRGVKLDVRRKSGEVVKPQVQSPRPLPGPPPTSPGAFFQLAQDSVVGTRNSFFLKELVDGPGEYTISAVTSPPFEKKFTDNQAALTSEDRISTDNSITIVVN